MSEKDYNKQVVKRERIRSTTLVVGVDVGNAFNAVGFMNKEGKVKLIKVIFALLRDKRMFDDGGRAISAHR